MQVIDNTDRHRFELQIDGEPAAVEVYDLRGDRIALVHTETLPGHEGEGLARKLVEAVLAEVRERGLGVIPECPYVRKVIADNPDRYLDLVPAELRQQFDLPAS